MPDIFVNYRTGYGEQAAAHLQDHLSGHFGIERVFRDSTSIPPGDNFERRLQTASRDARVLLAVMGEGWAQARKNGRLALEDPTDWVRREILNAREAGVRIVPVLCGHNMEPPSASELPPELAFLPDNQALRLDHRNTRSDLDQIADRLADLLPGRSKTETPNVQNINHGQAQNLIQTHQMGNLHIGDSHATSHFHGNVTGPLHTGTGSLYADRTREEDQ
ncbi:toll/interleukin-1 receptor domain-containing protein [Saccharopolyspora sp. TS4A08]|uniref:Toll/interleukin-1 receptor domain-containing protein n=1 Tax=Saccharopolyspora ipomoeae TaxID=3042027 RepID=A0ABT6PTY7_9PSEU|nr:toll/interleukin-1 receptor domain-containing protein [Saccharopolyspora sp. TS4A08]MDI2031460.1 toll/interleukin-1 receptor domain-containing protein [Saccharopolyspora sp. TS4A08]